MFLITGGQLCQPSGDGVADRRLDGGGGGGERGLGGDVAVTLHFATGDSEDDVAVPAGVGRPDACGDGVVGAEHESSQLDAVEGGVGGHHDQGGVVGERLGDHRRWPGLVSTAGEGLAFDGEHVADRVHGHDGTHCRVAGGTGCRSEATGADVLESAPFGGGGARPGADPSLFHGVGRGGAVCDGPLLRAGPHRWVAGEEVEEHGGGHDRHLPDQRVVAAPVGLQLPDHTVGGGETEGASAGEEDRLHLLHPHLRLEERVLPGARCGAAHLGRGNVGLREHHHGAPGLGVAIGPMPHPDTRDGGDRVVHSRYLRGTLGPIEQTISYETVPSSAAHSSAVTSSLPCRPMTTTSSPTDTGSSPTSTRTWSIVTLPASGYRLPLMSTSPLLPRAKPSA